MSKYLQEKDTYQYRDDEVVRAIVILEGAPVMETPYSVASVEAGVYAAQLRTEKTAVYQAMRANDVDYTLEHTFDTLLNGFSCDVAYGELDTIANLPGVASVHVSNVYSIPTPQEPNMSSANQMTGNALNGSGKGGEGIVVAVLDSGVHYTHDAFQDYGQLGEKKLTRNDVANADVPGQYINAKVPYGYDYADQDIDPDDDGAGTGGHGSHVAGIAVGYAESDGEITFSGAAPQAQLLAMKIFQTAESTTTSDIYFAALEDALKLGADVINMSIGSDSGFTHDDELDEVEENIYRKLENAGVVVCISAGNSNSMGEYSTKGYISTDYADYGVVGSPSTYANNISVASMENLAYPQQFIWVEGQRISYSDTSNGLWVEAFGDKNVEYVVLTDADGNLAMGTEKDYENLDEVYNLEEDTKIVVVSRGESSFSEKVAAAYLAGFDGLIVVNNQPGGINMSIDNFYVPAVSVELSAKTLLMGAEDKTVYTDAELKMSESSTAGELSDFSSWGTTPDLRMKPVLTSVGGNIWSVNAFSEDDYTLMSGTSMASPNLAGTFAVVLSKLYEENSGYPKEYVAEAAKLIMESSAELISDPGDYLYSVRKQGLGLGRSDNAMEAWAAGYVKDPIQELGANETGTYTFTVDLYNNSNREITYKTSAVVMTDTAYEGEVTFQPTYLYDTMTTRGANLNGATVSMPDTVTVAPGDSETVHVTVRLTSNGQDYIESCFENGSFVEGYVQFTPVTSRASIPVHAAFLGFYGDWGQAPALEVNDWADYLFWDDVLNTTPYGNSGYTYAQYGATPYMQMDVTSDVNWAYLYDGSQYINYLGANVFNNLLLPGTDANGNPVRPDWDALESWVPYNPAHNMLSTNAESAWRTNLLVQPFQLRNAQEIKCMITDAETGEVYFTDADHYIPKAKYNTTSGIWQTYVNYIWDGYDRNTGDIVPDGTEVKVSFDVTLADDDNTVQKDAWSFNLTMDSTAPELLSVAYAEPAEEWGDGTLTIEIAEPNLQAVCLSLDGEDVYDVRLFDTCEGDIQTVVFDIPSWWVDYGVHEAEVWMVDYALNETDTTALFLEPDQIGLPATITLVSPRGTTTIETRNGDYITFPNCTDVTTMGDNAEFVFWCDYRVEPVYSNEEFYQTYGYGSQHYAGDELFVTGDATFYAVYWAGTRVTLDPPHYVEYQAEDYTGNWAIVGVPNDGQNYLFEDLFVLEKDGRGYRLNDLDPFVEYDDTYLEFASSTAGLSFTFERLSDGSYTICNTWDYQYLAVDEYGELTMVSSADDDSALWEVNAYGSFFTMIQNKATGLVLSLNQNEAPYLMMQSLSEIYVAQLTALYQYTASEIVDGCYTSQLNAAGSGSTTTPSRPTTPGGSTHDPRPITRPDPATPEEGTNPPPVTTPEPESNTTVNADGSTTTTVTDNATGTVTTTTTRTDGSTVEKVVGSNQSVAITVTSPAGEVLVQVTLPATLPTSSTSFEDVPEGHWADEAIRNMIGLGLMNGTGDNQFDMEASMTRSMLAVVLFRLSNGKEGYTQNFGDVDANAWYADEVAWAAMAGIVTGSNGNFDPDGEITREQLATMLYRFANLLNLNTAASTGALNGFTDGGEVSTWAVDAMAWCVTTGIIGGDGSGGLTPSGTATRAQVAVMLQRFINLMK
ncbi:MAG: S8 family serine peptidase [Oscillibacter sp.]|nr:S8 family serine peptidase [Oscillibacter sp.]